MLSQTSVRQVFLVRYEVLRCIELDCEGQQRMKVKRCRFDGWHHLEMFAVSPCECYALCQAIQDVYTERERSRALGIFTTIVLPYMTDVAPPKTGL